MRYLLDTNVVSELRRPQADPAVVAWARATRPADLALSVVTVLEIELGILRRRRYDPTQADRLQEWFEQRVLSLFAEWILPVDGAVAREAATLHVPDPAPERDALVAATALVHDLVVVTRNVRDLERGGVVALDPWRS